MRRILLRVWRILRFLALFHYELIVANLEVAYHVLRPTRLLHPRIVAVPLDIDTDAQIALLAIFITLTPGSFTLDVGEDRRHIYVHSINVPYPDVLRRRIKRRFERRVKEVMS